MTRFKAGPIRLDNRGDLCDYGPKDGRKVAYGFDLNVGKLYFGATLLSNWTFVCWSWAIRGCASGYGERYL